MAENSKALEALKAEWRAEWEKEKVNEDQPHTTTMRELIDLMRATLAGLENQLGLTHAPTRRPPARRHQVPVTPEDIATVRTVLEIYQKPMTAHEIDMATDPRIGKDVASAACHALMDKDEVEKAGRKTYQLKRQPALEHNPVMIGPDNEDVE